MYTKPRKLNIGDKVAIISPSWAGSYVFPHVYLNGLKVLKKWGLRIKEMPSIKASPEYLWSNPKFRANDFNAAFADKSIKAIFTSIGGEDSVRILPFLDKKLIKKNPKILTGYSDATTLHVFCNINGLVTFYGPSIMSGFSQMDNLSTDFELHVHKMLFENDSKLKYQGYKNYSEGYPNWSKLSNIGKVNKSKPASPWNFIQGSGIVEGKLFGGCIEVLEYMKATKFWPKRNFWNDKILCLETSKDKPQAGQIRDYLRNYGMQGIYKKLSAIIFGRVRGYSNKETRDFNRMIIQIVNNEFNCMNLPIVTNFDFGHTDPQLVLPFGILTQIDCNAKIIRIIESWNRK